MIFFILYTGLRQYLLPISKSIIFYFCVKLLLLAMLAPSVPHSWPQLGPSSVRLCICPQSPSCEGAQP